jgi:hypothetical protein
MNQYTLIAELPGDCRTVEFEAGSDEDATAYAVEVIMTNAYGNKGPWATGYIELSGPGGYIVETMEAKETEPDLPVFSTMFHKMTGL